MAMTRRTLRHVVSVVDRVYVIVLRFNSASQQIGDDADRQRTCILLLSSPMFNRSSVIQFIH